MQKSWGVFRSNSQDAILFSLSFWMSVAEYWDWWAQQRAQGWSPQQARPTGAVHTLDKGVSRASCGPLCCNSEILSSFSTMKCKEMTESARGAVGTAPLGVLGVDALHAPASPPVLVKKAFPVWKQAAGVWSLFVGACVWDVIWTWFCKGFVTSPGAGAAPLEQLPSPQCAGSWWTRVLSQAPPAPHPCPGVMGQRWITAPYTF